MRPEEVTDAAVRAIKALDSVAVAKLLKAHPALIREGRSEEGHTLLEVALHWIVAHATVSNEALVVLKTLLQHNPDVNTSLDGRSPLHLACFVQHHEIVKALLRKGANVNARFNGETPLHIACKLGAIESVRLLTEKNGLELDAADMHGLTPLHYAVATCNKEIIHTLLTCRATVDAADVTGLTPLAAVIYALRADLVQVLVEHGADVFQPCGGLSPTDFAQHVYTERAKDVANSALETECNQIRSTLEIAPRMRALQSVARRDANPTLGSGRFGTCQRVSYKDRPAVVKTLFTTSPNLVDEFRSLASCKSEHIVKMYHWEILPSSGQWQLYLEDMDDGTLRSHLHKLVLAPDATKPGNINSLKVALSIARGLEALHTPKRAGTQRGWSMVHGNLKLDNVHFNTRGQIKLADFGLCRVEAVTMTHVNLLTEHYVAPEVFRGHKISTSADIYAFGVILAEMNMRAPAPRGSDEKARRGKYVPEMRPDCAAWYRELVQWCVAEEPKGRPKIDDVIQILNNPSTETINAVKKARDEQNKISTSLQAESNLEITC
ncbi:serine/threonine protein kinase [Saprolegnia parasitica CBS 223.65]|uniref:Serine/threonine protein kinase n=1 Tax=Saprolegnia parasitica (strain CBS 223.65) TaxID=695850 RepID=A0A067C415_SAPPC|nr:serine/threonine protein kinase [Saprolegnia parasitica CBS 223.65]KDO21281.1 serine/threonine protein kinase [Saprolegnia parasitica CBS 223.65]|eukprot:XP_012208024.1 serine/threonine protein kinase [Saprolegnia parasitica CBS 223.65]